MYNYGLYLSKPDIASAHRIGQVILDANNNRGSDSNLNYSEIDSAINSGQFSTGNHFFGPAYAGILAAKYAKTQNDIDYAVRTLRRVDTDNPFCRLLADQIELNEKLETAVDVFSEVGPFDAWKKTDIFSSYMDGVVNGIEKFLKKYTPPSTYPTILDIGTGTGILITRIARRLVEAHDLEGIRIILNDQSPSMLNSARKYCSSNLRMPHELVVLEGRIEDMTDEQLKQLRVHQPIWFSHASTSLHHMPEDQKIATMETLADLSDHLVIGDFEGNHDIPKPNSPELIYSIISFYGYLFRDILNSSATDAEKAATINQFLLAEAIIMLKSERKGGDKESLGRVDYHTSSEHWNNMANKAGYVRVGEECLVRIPKGRQVSFVLHFQKRK